MKNNRPTAPDVPEAQGPTLTDGPQHPEKHEASVDNANQEGVARQADIKEATAIRQDLDLKAKKLQEQHTEDSEGAKLMATKPQNHAAIANAYAGSLEWFQANLKQSQKVDPKSVRSMLGWFLMSHGITSDRAYRNVVPIKGEKYTLNDQTRKEVPGKSKQLLGREMNVGQINEAIWSMIKPLEPKLFALLKKPNLAFEELQSYVQKKYSLQISSFDEFYDNIDSFLGQVLPDQKAKRGFSLLRWLGLRK